MESVIIIAHLIVDHAKNWSTIMLKTITTMLVTLAFWVGSATIAYAESINSGVWTKKSNKIKGSWSIEQRDYGAYLVLDEAFKTRNAPDLKFVLSNGSVDSVNNKNAMQGALFVENLKSNKGAQSYRLPDNYTDYSTLLLHCEKFSKLWGAAAISK